VTRLTFGFAAVLSLISIIILRLQTGRVLAVFDFAYYTDVAIRIQHGLVPYRDIPLFASPGTFLELAGLFSFTGRDYFAIFALMAAKSAITCFAVVYLISARLRESDTRGRILIYGTISWISLLNVYALFFQPFYDADAVVAILISACLVVAAWTTPKTGTLRVTLLRVMAGMSILLPFFYKQTFGIAWLGILILAGMGAVFGSKENRGRVTTIGSGLLGAALLSIALLAVFGALHDWKYWTVDYPLTIRNSSYFALFGGLGVQERFIIGLLVVSGAVAASARASHALRNYPILILMIAPPLVWMYEFALAGVYSLDGASQVSLVWMPLLITCWLTAFLITAFRSPAWSIWDTILCATSAAAFAGLISQGFGGSTHSIWPIMILNVALVAAALTRLERYSRLWLITGGLVLTWIVFAVIAVDAYNMTRYAWIARPESPSAAAASFAWARTPGTFLADASKAATLFEKYSKLGPTTMFPGEEPVAFLTGEVPHSDISASDGTTNPSYDDLGGWLQRRGVKYVILRRDSQIPGDTRLSEIDDQLTHFSLVQKDDPFEVYERR